MHDTDREGTDDSSSDDELTHVNEVKKNSEVLAVLFHPTCHLHDAEYPELSKVYCILAAIPEILCLSIPVSSCSAERVS